MSDTLVDTNVLVDLLNRESPWRDACEETLERLRDEGDLIVNVVVLAELAAWEAFRQRIDALLAERVLRYEEIPMRAAALAGAAFRRYRQRGGVRRRMLADFLIGAHAAASGRRLVTRDRGHARHFRIEVVDPVVAH